MWLIIFTVINLLIILAYLSGINATDEQHPFFAALVYFPSLPMVIIPVILVITSLFRKKWKLTLINLAGSLLLLSSLGLEINIPVEKEAEFSVMTYNTISIRHSRKKYFDLIKKVKPDIFALQEFYIYNSDELNLMNKELADYTIIRKDELLLGSRFPVKSREVIGLNVKGPRSIALKADIDINGKTVTVYTLHLHTLLRPETLLQNKLAEVISKRQALRKKQWEAISAQLKKHSNPVIVAGDFNTPPRGRIYQSITSKLTDSFKSSGNGFGYTYGEPFPFLRIDYIFSLNDVKPVLTEVLEAGLSDHKPLITYFRTGTEP